MRGESKNSVKIGRQNIRHEKGLQEIRITAKSPADFTDDRT
jgi:hypothetical protein